MTQSDNVEDIRYLLNQDVTMSIYTSEDCYKHCSHCDVYTLVLDDSTQQLQAPCLEAIRLDNLEAVKLFEEKGSTRSENVVNDTKLLCYFQS